MQGFNIHRPSPLTGKSLHQEIMESFVENFPEGVSELVDSDRKLLAQGRWKHVELVAGWGIRVETTPMLFLQDGKPEGIELCNDHGDWLCHSSLLEAGYGPLIVQYAEGDEFDELSLIISIGT